MVSANHHFKGVGRVGKIEARWLPCSCDGCFSASPGAVCTQAIFNNPPKTLEVTKGSSVDTKALEEHISSRAGNLKRRMSSATGGCKGLLCCVYLNADDWAVGELAGSPRKLLKGGVLHKDGKGVAVFLGDKKQDVAALRRFVKVSDPTSKKRHLLKRSPAKECCDALISDCKSGKSKKACDKAHLGLVRIEALRPPLVNPKLKGVMGTEAEPVFELAPGVAQVFDQVCHISSRLRTAVTCPWSLGRRGGASRTRPRPRPDGGQSAPLMGA